MQSPNQSAAETARLGRYASDARAQEAANNRTLLNASNMASDADYYAPSYSQWPNETNAETARLAMYDNMARPTPEASQAAFRQMERDYREATDTGAQARSRRPVGTTGARPIAAGVQGNTDILSTLRSVGDMLPPLDDKTKQLFASGLKPLAFASDGQGGPLDVRGGPRKLFPAGNTATTSGNFFSSEISALKALQDYGLDVAVAVGRRNQTAGGALALLSYMIPTTVGDTLLTTAGTLIPAIRLEGAVAERAVPTAVENGVLGRARTGSATKTDPQHAFPDIVDNFVGSATKFSIPTKGAGGAVVRQSELYQVEGGLNSKPGVFEWIVDQGQVTHRRFIANGRVTGQANQIPPKQ
jgi:hypothetical protein